MADPTVQEEPTDPIKGGSYIRNPDGTLTRVEGPEEDEEVTTGDE